MYKFLFGFLLVLLAGLSIPFTAVAEDEDLIKMGVVDWRAALFQTKAAQLADEKMKKENQQLVNRVAELEQLVETKRRTLEKDLELLSAEEIGKTREELVQYAREYEAIALRLQEVQTQTETQFIVSQRKKIDDAIKALADKYQLDFVFERQAIVYGKKVRNLTKELIDELNKMQ